MERFTRIAPIVYALTVFTAGYFAASTIHDLWTQADHMNDRMGFVTQANGYDGLTPAAGTYR